MKTIITSAKLTILSLFIILIASISYYESRPVQTVQHEDTTDFQRAFFQASKVYGRAGCGDQKLAEMTAKHALETGLPPQVVAAITATESTCNPLAISNRGAVGLCQVVPKVWYKKFDFSKINLFNGDENMSVGTRILSQLVKDHGLKNGLARYYGTGPDDIGLGGIGYAERVLQLAGKL